MPEELHGIRKQPEPGTRPKQVVANEDEAKIQKPSFWKRVGNTFFMESASSVGRYLWNDVMLPAIKKLLVDSVNNAANRAVYGERYNGRNGQPNGGYAANSSVYQGRASGYYDRGDSRYDRGNLYNRVLEGSVFTYEETALEIIHRAMEWISDYGFISVSDFNYILPKQLQFNVAHTDSGWGWYSLNENCVQPLPQGGWTIDMPPARPRR